MLAESKSGYSAILFLKRSKTSANYVHTNKDLATRKVSSIGSSLTSCAKEVISHMDQALAASPSMDESSPMKTSLFRTKQEDGYLWQMQAPIPTVHNSSLHLKVLPGSMAIM